MREGLAARDPGFRCGHRAGTYRAAGGACDYRLFENSVHEWVAQPGPQTDKAREVVKEFIARPLQA